MMLSFCATPGLSSGPLLLRPTPQTHALTAPSMVARSDLPRRTNDAVRTQLESALVPKLLQEQLKQRKDRASQSHPFAEQQSAPAAEGAFDETVEDGLGLWGWRLALLLVTASWGANFPTTKLALDSLGGGAEAASLFIAGRFLLSAIVLAPAALSASSAGALRAGASIGGLCAFGYIAQAAALSLGSQPATCAFICSLQAVVVALITAWRGGGLALKTGVAVGLAISGIGFLELPEVLAGGLDALCTGDLVALGQVRARTHATHTPRVPR